MSTRESESTNVGCLVLSHHSQIACEKQSAHSLLILASNQLRVLIALIHFCALDLFVRLEAPS